MPSADEVKTTIKDLKDLACESTSMFENRTVSDAIDLLEQLQNERERVATKNTHTPTPWDTGLLGDGANEYLVPIHGNDTRTTIAEVYVIDPENDEVSWLEGKANLQLLVAAPKLLSALEAAADSMAATFEVLDKEHEAGLREAYEIVCEAIEEAKGQSA